MISKLFCLLILLLAPSVYAECSLNETEKALFKNYFYENPNNYTWVDNPNEDSVIVGRTQTPDVMIDNYQKFMSLIDQVENELRSCFPDYMRFIPRPRLYVGPADVDAMVNYKFTCFKMPYSIKMKEVVSNKLIFEGASIVNSNSSNVEKKLLAYEVDHEWFQCEEKEINEIEFGDFLVFLNEQTKCSFQLENNELIPNASCGYSNFVASGNSTHIDTVLLGQNAEVVMGDHLFTREDGRPISVESLSGLFFHELGHYYAGHATIKRHDGYIYSVKDRIPFEKPVELIPEREVSIVQESIEAYRSGYLSSSSKHYSRGQLSEAISYGEHVHNLTPGLYNHEWQADEFSLLLAKVAQVERSKMAEYSLILLEDYPPINPSNGYDYTFEQCIEKSNSVQTQENLATIPALGRYKYALTCFKINKALFWSSWLYEL